MLLFDGISCSNIFTDLKELCHSPTIKKKNQIVTAASSAICATSVPEGSIKMPIELRKVMPKFQNKNHFLLTV